MQDHSPRCGQMSGCSSCYGCPECRSMFPCDCLREIVGCPKCIIGAIGQECDWHVRMSSLGAALPPPRVIQPRPTMKPAKQPRDLEGRYTSRRYAQQLESIAAIVRKARESER